VVIASVAAAALVQFAGAVTPGPLNELPIDNPLGLAGPAGMVATVAFGVGLALHWGSLPAAAVCVLVRFRPTFRSKQSGTGATC
jgi:hypothetical protein